MAVLPVFAMGKAQAPLHTIVHTRRITCIFTLKLPLMNLPADSASPPSGDHPQRPQFVYVKIPVVKDAEDPFHWREDEIDQVLSDKGIGAVIGWGSSLGTVLQDGSREIAFTRIDINVMDLAVARALLQTTLPALDAPNGTEIHYTIEHQNLEDVLTPSGWLLAQPVFGSRHGVGIKLR